MRSRYSAYAKGLVEYIIETTDPAGPIYQANHSQWRRELQQFCNSTEFVGLSIEKVEDEFVTFEARLIVDGQFAPMVERSRFARPNERWLYHSGESPFTD